MRKLTLAAAALALSFGTTIGVAHADGYSGRGSIKDAAPVAYNWSGSYFGLQAGYGFGDSRMQEVLPGILGLNLPTLGSTHDVKGFQGGIQLGARRQFGALTIGAELGLGTGSVKGSTGDCFGITTLVANALAPGLATANCKTEVNWMATGLAKLGWAVDRWHLYGAAGWTVAGVDQSFNLSIPIAATNIAFAKNDIADGLTLGGGIEYALGNGLTFGVEYLYRELEHRGEGLLLGGLITTGRRDIDLHTVSATMNFKW